MSLADEIIALIERWGTRDLVAHYASEDFVCYEVTERGKEEIRKAVADHSRPPEPPPPPDVRGTSFRRGG